MKAKMTEANDLKNIIDITKFLDERGRITNLSKKKKIRVATLQYLADKFEENRDYSEKEVNVICEEWHTFGDFFILRREMIDNKLLCRESNGSRYWKA
ncbi:MAG: hypothetical protein PWP24_2016 [Clostridiales bacterium]|nr:hypothetical protein [Clostridiales bacterium]